MTPHTNHRNRRTPAVSAVAMLGLVLACLGLAACGSSSKSSSASTSAAAATSSTRGSGGPGTSGPNTKRFSALRECLQKNGITLPKRTPGQRGAPGAGGGFRGGSGSQLPNGVTQAQLQAALKKCGGSTFLRRRSGVGPGGTRRFAQFSACMRKNGVNLPTPNTSGKGPIFNTKGIDTTSAAFKAADAKCARELAPNGGTGAGGPRDGTPPAGGGTPGSGEAPPAG
jgi:hypothetical protein